MNVRASISPVSGGAASPFGQSLTKAITPASSSTQAGTDNGTAASTGKTTTAPNYGFQNRISAAAATTAPIAAAFGAGGIGAAAAAAARSGAAKEAFSGIQGLGEAAGKVLEGLAKLGKKDGGGKAGSESAQAGKAGSEAVAGAGKSSPCGPGGCPNQQTAQLSNQVSNEKDTSLAKADPTGRETQVADASETSRAESNNLDNQQAVTSIDDNKEITTEAMSDLGKEDEQKIDLAWGESGAESAFDESGTEVT